VLAKEGAAHNSTRVQNPPSGWVSRRWLFAPQERLDCQLPTWKQAPFRPKRRKAGGESKADRSRSLVCRPRCSPPRGKAPPWWAPRASKPPAAAPWLFTQPARPAGHKPPKRSACHRVTRPEH
jgi:hypothetical protein